MSNNIPSQQPSAKQRNNSRRFVMQPQFDKSGLIGWKRIKRKGSNYPQLS